MCESSDCISVNRFSNILLGAEYTLVLYRGLFFLHEPEVHWFASIILAKPREAHYLTVCALNYLSVNEVIVPTNGCGRRIFS